MTQINEHEEPSELTEASDPGWFHSKFQTIEGPCQACCSLRLECNVLKMPKFKFRLQKTVFAPKKARETQCIHQT